MASIVDFGGLGGTVISWTTSIGFWIVFCFLAGLIGLGGLWLRKRRKLNKPVIQMYDLGNGVFDFDITKGGWFKKRFTLFNLWDYGSEQLFRLKDNTPVYDVSHNDYRKINGINGIVVVRDPLDPKFSIPISQFFLTKDSTKLLAQIAPADLRDSAVMAIESVDLEMRTKWQQYAPLVAIGFVGLVLIFSILLIAQYGKHNIDSTKELLKYVADKIYENSGTTISQTP